MVAYKRFQYSDLTGKLLVFQLENWSPRRGGPLREVVVARASTVVAKCSESVLQYYKSLNVYRAT